MPANEYLFLSQWRLKAEREEVFLVLSDPADLVRWWPSVYLDVREIERGAEDGVGKVIDLYTKGWLPYTLRWRFRVTEVNRPGRLALEAEGDFAGHGVWTLEEKDGWTLATYDWRIRAEKPLLRYLSPVLRPLFSANHRWAMKVGEKSLRLELARRHAASEEERQALPAAPAATPKTAPAFFAWLAGELKKAVLGSRKP